MGRISARRSVRNRADAVTIVWMQLHIGHVDGYCRVNLSAAKLTPFVRELAMSKF